MSIDEKLIDIILGEYDSETEMSDTRQLRVKNAQWKIDAIKQAFADEVMPKLNQINKLTADIVQEAQIIGSAVPILDTNLLSGQEWYEKFIECLLDDDHFDGEDVQWDNLLAAAERASGLTDEPQYPPFHNMGEPV